MRYRTVIYLLLLCYVIAMCGLLTAIEDNQALQKKNDVVGLIIKINGYEYLNAGGPYNGFSVGKKFTMVMPEKPPVKTISLKVTHISQF